MPHHQHLCVPMFVKFYVIFGCLYFWLFVCVILDAMVVFVNRQLIASLIVIIGSISSPSFHHHPPHILTHSHFSPFHPSPSSQAPPSSYPPPRYIYTSMPSLCVLYTVTRMPVFSSAHKLPLYSRNQIVVPNRNFLPSLTIFLLEPFFLEGMTLNQIISVQVINHQ